MNTEKIENWLERVKIEKIDLDYKISKLETFMKYAPTTDISNHMLYLLTEQLMAMKNYSYYLGERIKEGEKNE